MKNPQKEPYYVFLDPSKYVDDFSNVYNYPQLTFWQSVRSYDEFVTLLTKEGMPKGISFCHNFTKAHKEQSDIALAKGSYNYSKLDNKTGYHAAKWLCAFARITKKPIPDFYVHESCKHGSFNIRKVLQAYKAGILPEETFTYHNRPLVLEVKKKTQRIIIPVTFKPEPKKFQVTKFEA